MRLSVQKIVFLLSYIVVGIASQGTVSGQLFSSNDQSGRPLSGHRLSNLRLSSPGLSVRNLPIGEIINDQQGLPQSFVSSMVQDRQGFIWAGTRDGLCRYDGVNFKIFRPGNTHKSLSFTSVLRLSLDYKGRIWIVSEESDIDIFDPLTEKFTSYSKQDFYVKNIGKDEVYDLYFDHRDRLWLGLTKKGLVMIDIRSRKIRVMIKPTVIEPSSYHLKFVLGFAEDLDKNLWFISLMYLHKYDEKTGKIKTYVPDPNSVNALPHHQLSSLSSGSDGSLYIGSHYFLTAFNPRKEKFTSYLLPETGSEWWKMRALSDHSGTIYFYQHNLLFRIVKGRNPEVIDRTKDHFYISMCMDRSDVLWVGTNGGGIKKYDLRRTLFSTAAYKKSFFEDILTDYLGVPATQLKAIGDLKSYNFRYAIDAQKRLWTTSGSSEIYRTNLVTRKTEIIPFAFSIHSIVIGYPLILQSDPLGNIWALFQKQIWKYNGKSKQWDLTKYVFNAERYSAVVQILIDKQAIWLATESSGLFRLDLVTTKLQQFANRKNDPKSLASDAVYYLSDDPADPNRLWLGTFGGGVSAFDKRTGTFRSFTVADGLPNNVAYFTIPDAIGNLWIGTNKGLSRMNRKTFKIHNYTRADGIMAEEFNRFHVLHLPDDQIIMGGMEGVTSFFPKEVRDDVFQPPIEITDLKINNTPASPSVLDSLPIQAVKELTLPYDQNFITAEFAVLQFNRQTKNRYRYKLEGLEKNWKETNRPVATYTNLPPDDYVMVVNASNTSGNWSPHTRRLGIHIRPPFWATFWAYLFYALTLAGIVWALIRNYQNRLRLRQKVTFQEKEAEIQQKEADQLRRVDEIRTRFFSNITHEFRTPLTLILTPIQNLQKKYTQPEDLRQLYSVEKNANHLLELINQLLDLSKLESEMMVVNESRGELVPFVEALVKSFHGQAESRGITLRYDLNAAGNYWFDKEKLVRILYNLLGNAIKFTPAGGTVDMRLTRVENGVSFTISDTGKGIPTDQLPFIFNRFYQVDDSSTRQAEGTGIGLALVKELIEIQHGHIEVESELNTRTTFTFDLPYRFIVENTPAPDLVAVENVQEDSFEPASPLLELNVGSDRPLILLVEDNAELAEFIEECLPQAYRIFRAANGLQGQEQALALIPDLIISDVLMPIMDGFEMTRLLKTDIRTNHIPVILLTAKASVDSRLQGLTFGADDYLTKPFVVAELQARVHNRLVQQQRDRERISASITNVSEPVEDAIITPGTDPFLEKIYQIIDVRLDDSSFGAEELAEQIGMSRQHLYRKLKTITGFSVNDILRNYRLKRAGQYLRTGHTATETGYMVGFESPSYFSKCFRELYGIPPSDFLARQN